MPRRKKRGDETLFKVKWPTSGTKILTRSHGRSSYQGPWLFLHMHQKPFLQRLDERRVPYGEPFQMGPAAVAWIDLAKI